MAKASGNFVSIDIARGIAALGVFFYHQHVGTLLAKYSHLNWLNFIDIFGAVYAVPFFFLISGYCIHLSNIKYLKNRQNLPVKEYYKRRLLRIYPPYIVAVAFSLLVNLITQPRFSTSITDIIVHVFLLQGFTAQYFNTINVVLWTISVEMAFYVLYPLFYKLRLKHSLNSAMLFAAATSTISIGYLSIKGNVSIPQFYSIFNLWFAWCAGACLADKQILQQVNFNRTAYYLLYSLILIIFVALKMANLAWLAIVEYQFNILIWIGPLAYIVSNEKHFARVNGFVLKIFVAIGLSSYSLYLFHDPLISLKNYLIHLTLPASMQFVGMLIGVLIIPVVTWLAYLAAEKPFIPQKRKLAVDA